MRGKVWKGLMVFLAVGVLVSGLSSLLGAKAVMEAYGRLKIPTHLGVFLGVAKLFASLGLVLVLWKRDFVRFRQWVFAGLIFNMAGALWWHVAAGDSLQQTGGPLFLLPLIALTWWLGEKELG